MDAQNTKSNENLRQFFKRFNLFMYGMWRLGLRRWVNAWPSVGGRIMVLTHTGRKTGLRRRTPVNYYRQGDCVYLTAGFGALTDWYRNLQTNPKVEVWLPDSRWTGVAEELSQDEDRLPLLRQVILASGIVGPLMGVDPRRMSDQAFDQATASYRLMRIRLSEPLSGPGGPGDLAWVWIPVGLVGLLAFARRWKRK